MRIHDLIAMQLSSAHTELAAQGVNFRYHTHDVASKLGLCGFCHNTPVRAPVCFLVVLVLVLMPATSRTEMLRVWQPQTTRPS